MTLAQWNQQVEHETYQLHEHNPDAAITMMASGADEMIRVTKEGFWVRGVKVEQDDKEAETVVVFCRFVHDLDAVERERSWNELVKKREASEVFKKNNLEYDLRSTKWICDKAKASEIYAQNIYAALCNQDWQKNDVWPLLKGETYSCSWRYAGGIVADMIESGDYIDWYCSGIRDEDSTLAESGFVPESVVTEEIREDFFKLGWIPVASDSDDI